jgi:predicted DNA-binding antitoxin AbrB/MazE fold protein
MTINVHATYRDGLIHPDHPLNLPEGTELQLTVVAGSTSEHPPVDKSSSSTARILSPRLAQPEQIADFQMDVREISDAGL